MEELRDEAGAKESFTRKLVITCLLWAGEMERTDGEYMTKRAKP